MLIRAKAPLRISFAGGGTDVPPYPEKEGGCVLNATINKYAYGTLRPRKDGQIKIESLDFGISVNYDVDEELIYDGKLDLVKAAIKKLEGQDSTGFDLFLHSDAPPGTGLGSSSTVIVVLVGLLKEFKNMPLTDYEIANLAYIIERKELGIKGGLQDQYTATFGGFNFIEFLKDRVIVNPLKISQDVINELEHNLLLCYTGRTRLSARIIEDQVSRYERREEETLQALRNLKEIAVEMKNALLRKKLNEFGELLHYAWENKKRMSDKISNPEIEKMYEEARKTGALGGKISGAGGGGYMLLYCKFEKKHKVAERLKEMGGTIVDFAFDPYGLQTWRVDE
ncbi:MAG TPA: GHMP kinase [Deltaproteobacteria bacterium]|nr:GHMP kinase [Deltaproteobacteria bacterium]